MDKYQFIKRQLAKTNKKNDENYIITRIWNKLDNLDIKFITQRYVTRKNGYAKTDMYFPQIDLHVEINEGYHLMEAQIRADEIRKKDIISATNHDFRCIDVTKDLLNIHEQIDEIIDIINNKIHQKGNSFVPWDIDKEMNPQTFIQLGYLDVKDNVAFKVIADACNCFGHEYTGFQRGGTKHPYRDNVEIWFPHLFRNKDWDNTISEDETIIREKSMNPNNIINHMEKHINGKIHKRIVFPYAVDNLGFTLYRFKGEYELDVEQSYYENCLVWKRIATRVNTYAPKTRNLKS